jgi:hypothetical protein
MRQEDDDWVLWGLYLLLMCVIGVFTMFALFHLPQVASNASLRDHE